MKIKKSKKQSKLLTQTENKETAPQAVPANAVEEKKAVQEDEEEVSSQSEQHQQTAEQYQQPAATSKSYISFTISGTAAIWKWAAVWTVLAKSGAITTSNKISTGKDNVLLINRHTTSSRIKEISSSLFTLW